MVLQGIISPQENPSEQEANDSLYTLNEIIDKWNIEKLLFSSIKNLEINLTGLKKYTVGPTGDIVSQDDFNNGFLDVYYEKENILTNRLQQITLTQYNNINNKDLSNISPDRYYFNNTYPNIKLFFYPIANNGKVVLSYYNTFKGFNSLDEEIDLPSAYIKALRYNLALEIGIEYGVATKQEIISLATSTKTFIKGLNNSNNLEIMYTDPYLNSYRRNGYNFNIYRGN